MLMRGLTSTAPWIRDRQLKESNNGERGGREKWDSGKANILRLTSDMSEDISGERKKKFNSGVKCETARRVLN